MVQISHILHYQLAALTKNRIGKILKLNWSIDSHAGQNG